MQQDIHRQFPLRHLAAAAGLLALALIAAPALAATEAPKQVLLGAPGASAPTSPHGSPAAKAKKAPAAPLKVVDLNNASAKELQTLPGIGKAEAERIIANRPYKTKTELVSKKVLPLGPYLSLKAQVSALKPPKPAQGAASKPAAKAKS
ncbi:Helix-hairpin-helix domain-containing protein [Rubrivivax sp. A210]|uniref:ComEA family DNA-binding protein n=1 Tax=Rubrivivax sp. A210 TaxID=2772301 RepID=UPI001917C014|nr:helix-hairpin-helix domain-containing protein [Rubrivivax sp. A210]CAD5375037.1 Helix-hairpin-helix domain-containing protein [Rubrivivax sp. A210]